MRDERGNSSYMLAQCVLGGASEIKHMQHTLPTQQKKNIGPKAHAERTYLEIRNVL